MQGSNDKLAAKDGASATLAGGREVLESTRTVGVYHASLMRVDAEYAAEAEALSAQIQVAAEHEVARLVARLQSLPRHEVWADQALNVVTDVGVHDVLDKYLGLTAPTSVYMGLKGTGTATAAHTMASHAAWLEVGLANAPAYTGNRPTPAFSAATARAKATSSAVSFTFTSGGTVAGCFLVMTGSNTKDNTTGILLSAGDFTGGNKTVANTDVLNVTYSLTMT